MNAPIDFVAVKNRQMSAWASGDYAVVGTTLQLVGELLAEACDLRWDERVLDVAAGNGNATLAAARRGCLVTSTDYVAGLLERSAERAQAERLQGQLPGGRRRSAALRGRQLRRRDLDLWRHVHAGPGHGRRPSWLRVCRPGGRIGLANWTPDGLHRPDVQGAGAPCRRRRLACSRLRCGATSRICRSCSARRPHRSRSRRDISTSATARRRTSSRSFAPGTARCTRPSPRLPADKALLLEKDLSDLLNSLNRAGPTSLVVPSEYLEVVITRR